MVKRLFLTPPNLPETTAQRCLVIPDSKEWWGVLNAALLLLTQEWQYEQVHETDLTPAEVAAYFAQVYNNYLTGDCGVRDVRQSLTDPCTLEKTFDGMTWIPFANILLCAGIVAASVTPLADVRVDPLDPDQPQFSPDGGTTWIDIPGDPDAPPIVTPPPPVPGPDPDAQACLGSRRAALVLGEFYKSTYGAFTANLLNTINGVNTFLSQLNQALFNLVYPQAAQVMQALGFGAQDFTTEYTAAELSSGVLDALTCLLLDNATVPFDGIVQFDFEQVQTDMIAAVGLNPGVALQSLLTYLQSGGLNAASGTAVVDTYDCSGCFPTCLDFAFSDGNQYHFSAASPTLATWSGDGWTRGSGSPATASLLMLFGGSYFIERIEIQTTGDPILVANSYVQNPSGGFTKSLTDIGGGRWGVDINESWTGITGKFGKQAGTWTGKITSFTVRFAPGPVPFNDVPVITC